MSLTPEQIDALPEYTNTQMVRLLRYAIAQLAAAGPEGSVTVIGRQWTLRDMDQLKRMLATFQALAADDADGAAVQTTGCPVVAYQEPQS